MDFSNIRMETDADGVSVITINRPEKLNALNRDVMAELRHAFESVASDSAIRGLIVTGAGDKAFIAGADIRELAAINAVGAERLSALGQSTFRMLETMGKPSVAAINGFSLGGGMELALACTARVASENAKLGQPEVKLGIVPGYGATQRLPRLVGRAHALELLLTGEPISAAEAYRIGLVNHVVPQAELLTYCSAWVRKVLANGPLAVGLTMQAVDAGYDAGMEAGFRFEALAFGLTAATEDRREGTQAFLDKREPRFAGN